VIVVNVLIGVACIRHPDPIRGQTLRAGMRRQGAGDHVPEEGSILRPGWVKIQRARRA
jgi:hypothetical protein